MSTATPQRITRFAAVSIVGDEPVISEIAFPTREAAEAHCQQAADLFEARFGHRPLYPTMTVQVDYTEPDGLDAEFSDWQAVAL
jgi:hypothetical protein